jgi:hypothetical protein
LHCTQNQKDGTVFASARSKHPGGVIAMYADGSSKFTADSIDATVWKSVSTRAGGESGTAP